MILSPLIYRPSWVSGKYVKSKRVALVYNLIEGTDFLFEAESADVLGLILSFPRNTGLSLSMISLKTNISEESLSEFFEELKSYHLLTSQKYTEKETDDYRYEVNSRKKDIVSQFAVENEAENLSDAENAYFNLVEQDNNVIWATLELTYRCSVRCIHCYNIGASRNAEEKSHREEIKELTWKEYKRLIDELVDLGVTLINITGGDPFSHIYIWTILEYLYEKDVAVTVMTNGVSIITDTKRLANLFPKKVQISLYSNLPEVHDYITQVEGSWNRTMKVIQSLSSLSVPLAIACCVMQPNFHSYRGVRLIANKYNAEMLYDLNVTDSIEGDICSRLNLRLKPTQLYIVLQDENVPFHVNSRNPSTLKGLNREANTSVCRAGLSVFNITPEGDVTACPGFHIVYGSIRDNSLEDVISNSSVLKAWRNTTFERLEECGNYEYCPFCHLCPGNNYIDQKTYLKPGENNCYFAKVRYKLIKDVLEKGLETLSSQELENEINKQPVYIPQKLYRNYKK